MPITNCYPQYITPEIIMHSFSVTSANIAVDDILLKLDSFKLNYIFFVPDGIDFDVIGPESNRIR